MKHDSSSSWRRPTVGLLRTVVLVTSTLIVSCHRSGSSARSESGELTSAYAAVTEAVFAVDGMTCGSCNVTVRVAAEKVNGVVGARVSRSEKRAWVTFDPARTSAVMIARAITDAGYPATPTAK